MTGEFRQDTGGEEQRLTGKQLHAYIDRLLERSSEEGVAVDEAMVRMSRLLADRTGQHERGLDSLNYAFAIQTIVYDCGITGVDGFTEEPMPAETTGLSSESYRSFRTFATGMARDVMGEDFGTRIDILFTMGSRDY